MSTATKKKKTTNPIQDSPLEENHFILLLPEVLVVKIPNFHRANDDRFRKYSESVSPALHFHRKLQSTPARRRVQAPGGRPQFPLAE